MRIATQFEALRAGRGPLVLAAGFFDGVHRGHQAIVREVLARAAALGGRAWVMTFDRHPLAVLHPDAAPPLLTPTPDKLRLLEAMGVAGCLVLPFTRALAAYEPEAFMRTLVRHAPGLRHIVVGRNWTFGRAGRGTPALLRRLGAGYGVGVTAVPPVRHGGAPVSSTRIRRAIARGRLREAATMLGRPPAVAGTVVRGRGLGRRLGVPTANIRTAGAAVPPDGVYVVQAGWRGAVRHGVANLGVRPTLAPERARSAARLLEVHLFDWRRPLYGRRLDVRFLHRLRPERRFASLERLRLQMRRDRERARAWAARWKPVPS